MWLIVGTIEFKSLILFKIDKRKTSFCQLLSLKSHFERDLPSENIEIFTCVFFSSFIC